MIKSPSTVSVYQQSFVSLKGRVRRDGRGTISHIASRRAAMSEAGMEVVGGEVRCVAGDEMTDDGPVRVGFRYPYECRATLRVLLAGVMMK